MPAIKIAASRAIITEQQLGVSMGSAGGATRGELQSVQRIGSAKSWARPDAGKIAAIQSAGLVEVESVFAHAPKVLEREKNTLKNVVAAQESPNMKFFGAGVSRISYQRVSVTGNTAEAVSDVDTWSHFAMKDAGGRFQEVCPQNTLVVTTSLELSQGQWVVTDLRWVFTPSTMP